MISGGGVSASSGCSTSHAGLWANYDFVDLGRAGFGPGFGLERQAVQHPLDLLAIVLEPSRSRFGGIVIGGLTTPRAA